MRIIGGRLKGRRFYPPADKWPTRPTTDFAKEALFNVLHNRYDLAEIRFLDLFGGTGSHCFEMISRGCCDATYVDKFGPCVRFVGELARELDVTDCLKIHRADVFRFIRQTEQEWDYIFAGPPYALAEIPLLPDLVFQNDVVRKGGLFILEHNHRVDMQSHPRFQELRTYGQCHFSFFKNAGE
ncbi:MAG: RsmD family RNA methyltransferase [Saprospiraceae bacterium]|nr:RsmD family RNA methyltransferase [Saprospiraceae bacterium]